MAYDRSNRYADDSFSVVFEKVFQHVPNFDEHRASFLRFLNRRDMNSVEIYLEFFRRDFHDDREFVKETIKLDPFAELFKRLPLELRSDPELCRLAVEHVKDSSVRTLVDAIPIHVLEENEIIIFRALETLAIFLDEEQIPRSFWSRREFVLLWAKTKYWVPLHLVSKELYKDREVCLSLCQSRYHDVHEILDKIPKPFLSDKEFVLECLMAHPKLFECCDNVLQRDFDVVLAAAFGAIRVKTFYDFIDELGESLDSFAFSVYKRIAAHDEFMTLLACWWKSRKTTSVRPMSVLNCDDETARGLQTIIASYLGLPTKDALKRLTCVWDGIVMDYVERDALPAEVVQLIQPQALMENILKVIENGRPVVLKRFPDELWTKREFVLWAAASGLFHKAISGDFSKDPEICLTYYRHSPMVRRKILPWISDSLVADRDFVLNCVNSDPLILSRCSNDGIRFDYKILLAAIIKSADSTLHGLPEASLVGGWTDSLMCFVNTLRAKMEAFYALESFQTQVGKMPNKNSSVVLLCKERIGSYLGVPSDEQELIDSSRIWSNRSIFYLAMGGNIEELCKASKFWLEPQPKRRSFGSSHVVRW
jgi:hypothetical protein